jgi:hypothetical protein
LILFFHLHLGLPSGFFPWGCMHFAFPPYMLHVLSITSSLM